ncbi:hypothetical protein X975_07201, partial [Stegodyphus mimosarum]
MMREVHKDVKYLMKLLPTVMHNQMIPACENRKATAVDNYLKMLPIKTLEDLDLWEDILSDDDSFQNLVHALANKGGQTVEQTTRRILSDLFTDEVSSKINWAGRGEKQSFKTFKSCALIYKAVRSNPSNSSATEKQMEETIKQWLKAAPLRARYTEKKHVKWGKKMCV